LLEESVIEESEIEHEREDKHDAHLVDTHTIKNGELGIPEELTAKYEDLRPEYELSEEMERKERSSSFRRPFQGSDGGYIPGLDEGAKETVWGGREFPRVMQKSAFLRAL